jgi:hypothetical protein
MVQQGTNDATEVARARADLLRRLHDSPHDFAATKALQELTSVSRHIRPVGGPAAQDAIVHAGLSGTRRMRRWITRKIR